jgi:hypothetical protein
LPLVAAVKDSSGNPVPEAAVSFAVSTTTPAGGAFAVGNKFATTNASGIATSATLIANNVAGTFTVTASVGTATPAYFTLTNTSGIITIPTNVTVNVGASVPFPITLSAGAPLGGTSIALMSSDPSKVSVTPQNVLFPEDSTTVAPPYVTGIGLGTATITASGPGYTTVSQSVSSFGSLSFSQSSLAIAANGIPTTLYLSLAGALTSDLAVNLSSSNAAIASVPSTVTIKANTLRVSVPITGIQPGSAIIHASVLPYVADTTLNVVVTIPFQIANAALSPGQVGTLYSQTLVVRGGTPPYAWTISGTLPAGLTFATSGLLSGTPTASAVNLPLTFTVADSSVPVQVATMTLTLNIAPTGPPGSIILPANLTVGVGQSTTFPISLTTPAPSGGLSVTLQNSDPSKVNVMGTIFFIQGTTAPLIPIPVNGMGVGSVTIKASAPGYSSATETIVSTDSIGFSPVSVTIPTSETEQLLLNLSAAASNDVVVSLSSSNTTVASVPPTVTIKANSTSVTVPVIGVHAGSAIIHASFLPGIADTTATVTVLGGLGITTTSLADGEVGRPYSQTLGLIGGTSPYTWSIVGGTLPNGLTFNSATGVLSGTPIAPITNASLTFKVTDSSTPTPQTASTALTLTINGGHARRTSRSK